MMMGYVSDEGAPGWRRSLYRESRPFQGTKSKVNDDKT